MDRASLASVPDVLDARDIAKILGVGYTKALKVIRYGGFNYIRIGKTYKVSKQNFINWLDCSKSEVLPLN